MRLQSYISPLRRLRIAPRSKANLRDLKARKTSAEAEFEARKNDYPLGTIGRGRLLLRLIEASCSTSRLSSEYFSNLEAMLQSKSQRARPGQIIIGLGSGRCGSTSLAALLATTSASCATHENPPLIGWAPRSEQVEFHFRRFKLLASYYAIVADVSHWWLNTLDEVFGRFRDSKAIGLIRDTRDCANSFMKVKDEGPRSMNHWAPSGNHLWRENIWDNSYPTYPIPDGAFKNPRRAKAEMIARYIDEYNTSLRLHADKYPDRMLVLRTEEFSDSKTQKEISKFIDASLEPFEQKLNVRTVAEGESDIFIF